MRSDPHESGAIDLTDRYVVEATIGAGGMATVARARDRLTGERVALKRLHEHLSGDVHFEKILLDEARLQSLIRHPNVVGTMAVGSFDGRLTLVLELVDGPSLVRLMLGDDRVAIGIAVEVACQVLAGLAAAHDVKDEDGHAVDLVHRDVSPHNILVGRDGTVKLADFGVARARARLQTTSEGRIKGKLAYMSPEQIEGRPLDARSDLFAAGVVLWELLTGTRLFEGASEGEIVRKVLSLDIPPPSTLRRGIPSALDAVVAGSLARDPARRWESGRAMHDAIAAAFPRAGRAALAEAVPEPASAVHVASRGASPFAATIEEGARARQPNGEGTQMITRADVVRRRSRARFAPLAVAALVALGAVAALGMSHRAKSDAPPAATAPSAEPSATTESPPEAPRVAEEPTAAAAFASPPVAPSARPPPPIRGASGTSSTKSAAARASAPPAPPSSPPDARSCDPPYRVDPRGVRVFRPECL